MGGACGSLGGVREGPGGLKGGLGGPVGSCEGPGGVCEGFGGPWSWALVGVQEVWGDSLWGREKSCGVMGLWGRLGVAPWVPAAL